VDIVADERDDCPRSSTVDALAGEIDRVRRTVDNKAAAEEVDRLARVVSDLADAVKATQGRSGESSPPVSWLALPADDATARGLLADLVEWLGTVYLRYADAARGLPECWLWHTDIVEELVWLMSAWLAAYQGNDASVRAAADWHDRLRPAVVRRIGDYAKACSLENHLPDRATAAPAVPVVEAVEAIALWWADHRGERAPAPTDDQMIAAAAAARRARQGGGG
jgi:hypothetical protein